MHSLTHTVNVLSLVHQTKH